MRRSSDAPYAGLNPIDRGLLSRSGLMAGGSAAGAGAGAGSGGVGGAYFEWPSRAEVLPICRSIVVATATNELAVGLRAAPFLTRNSAGDGMNLGARKPVSVEERCEQVMENAWTLVRSRCHANSEQGRGLTPKLCALAADCELVC